MILIPHDFFVVSANRSLLFAVGFDFRLILESSYKPLILNMAAWKGSGETQEELMAKDDCILVDENDKIVGHLNKKECHQYTQQHVCICATFF